ncbi:hypothetical protein NJ76_30290, partial [Rhodococcus sp. IITR03]
MRVVFAGTPEPAVPSLLRLIESSRHEVVAVVTAPTPPPVAAGRSCDPLWGRSPTNTASSPHAALAARPHSSR